MDKPLRIIDEYHDHPRPGFKLPVWSRECGAHFIEVPPITHKNEQACGVCGTPIVHNADGDERCGCFFNSDLDTRKDETQ